MTFTDLTFIFIFLSVALLLYHIVAKRFREIILLAVSLLFYACGSLQYFGLLLAMFVADVALGEHETMVNRNGLNLGVEDLLAVAKKSF